MICHGCQRDCARMEEALKLAAQTFREQERVHREAATGHVIPGANSTERASWLAKAEYNAAKAEMCERALASTPPPSPATGGTTAGELLARYEPADESLSAALAVAVGLRAPSPSTTEEPKAVPARYAWFGGAIDEDLVRAIHKLPAASPSEPTRDIRRDDIHVSAPPGDTSHEPKEEA